MRSVKSRFTLVSAVVGCLLTLSSGACDSKRPSTSGVSTAPTEPVAGTVTLSGTVTERFSGEPIDGVSVGLFPMYPNGPPRWPPGGGYQRTPSDFEGRYTITGIPAGFGYFVMASYRFGTYAQQCLTTVMLHSDAHKDVTLTSPESRAAGNSLRPPQVPGTRVVSGVVFELTEAGRQPVEDAWIGFTVDPSGDVAGAEALSDASGRYLLCGLPETRLTSLFAWKNGYSAGNWSVDAGSDTTLDIELKR